MHIDRVLEQLKELRTKYPNARVLIEIEGDTFEVDRISPLVTSTKDGKIVHDVVINS